MLCSVNSPAQRRFYIHFYAAAVGFYPLCVVLAFLGVHFGHPGVILTYLMALVPTLPIAWALVAAGRYLAEEKDEFIRNLQAQSALGGTGATLVVATMWGFLEKFAHVQHLDPLWIWPIFCFCTGISYGLVTLRYR